MLYNFAPECDANWLNGWYYTQLSDKSLMWHIPHGTFFHLKHWNLLSITNSVAELKWMRKPIMVTIAWCMYAKSTARQTVIVLSVWNKLLLHFHCLFNSLWGIGNSSTGPKKMIRCVEKKKREQQRFSEQVKFWILLWLIQLAWQCTSVICQSNNPHKHRWMGECCCADSSLVPVIRKQTMHHSKLLPSAITSKKWETSKKAVQILT